MKKAIDSRICLKPIFSNVVHTAAWEGPCRVGPPEVLEPAYEIRAGHEQCEKWGAELQEQLSGVCEVLPPSYIEYSESFFVSDEKLEKLRAESTEADLFIISYRVPGLERLGKPITMLNNGPTPVDLGAYYKNIGKEFYFAHDYDEYRELLHLLQVRKAIQETKLLVLTLGDQFPFSVVSSNPDLTSLEKLYGIRGVRRSLKEVFNYIDQLDNDEEVAQEARQLKDQATVSHVKEEAIACDLRYYHAVNKMMEDFGCNAFTTACKELCATQLPMHYTCTPCLTHALLKDRGIPSACEEDLNVWLAICVFTYLSRKSVFMGNPSFVHAGQRPIEDLHMSRLVSGPPEGFQEDVLEIRHSVPGLLLEGLDSAPLPYEIGHFTHAGWGSKIQIDMASREEKIVTIGRFSRDGRRIMVTRGEILGCAYDDIGCSPAVYYRVEGGARRFRHALAEGEYGHHLAVVYGDYISELEDLSKIVGFEVEQMR